MKKGRDLETLVEIFETNISFSENRTVMSPYLMRDAVTGQQREFDVMVTVKSGHLELKTAFECKDWKRSVDVQEVEGFYTKCKNNRIHQGVLVSSNGFTEPAIKMADHFGFKCLTLSGVGEIKNLLAEGVTLLKREIVKMQLNAHYGDAKSNILRDEDFDLVIVGKERLLDNRLAEYVYEVLNLEQQSNESVYFNLYRKFGVKSEGSHLKSKFTEDMVPITHFTLDVELKIVQTLAPFKKMSYQDANLNTIANIAVSKVDTGFAKGSVIFLSEGENSRLIFKKDEE